MNTRLPVATAVVVAPAAVGCGTSGQDPAAVLTAYEVARNAGDVATASAFFADDAELNGHPLDQRQRLGN